MPSARSGHEGCEERVFECRGGGGARQSGRRGEGVRAIARAEAGEAAAAVEIAIAAGDAEAAALEAVLVHADRFVAMMTRLIR